MKLKISPNLKRIVKDDIVLDRVTLPKTLDEIEAYVKSHTSGIRKYDNVCEGGNIIVTLNEFINMVNEGYNIISAEVLNENMISIDYQKEIKKDKIR